MDKIKSQQSFSVLIPDGETYFALPVLQCIGRAKNVSPIVLSSNPLALSRFSKYSKHYYNHNKPKNDEEKLDHIYEIIKRTQVDTVLPTCRDTSRLFSLNKETLSRITAFPLVPKVEMYDIAINKWLLYNWMIKKNVSCPRTILYRSSAGFVEALSSMQFPVLLKPTKRQGGSGVKYFDNASSLLSFCRNNIRQEEFIVQSYINGYDIDFSALCKDGEILANTISKGTNKNHSFSHGPVFDFIYDSSIYNFAKDFINKLGWSGVINIDLRYDEQDKQIKVLEINPRYWGTLLGSYYAGVNFPYLACLSSLNIGFQKIEGKPMRFVLGSEAIKIKTKKLINRKQNDLYFDSSNLEIRLKDPLPKIIDIIKLIPKRIIKFFGMSELII